MSPGGNDPPDPPHRPFISILQWGYSECWLANAKFSLFLRYFSRLPSNQIFWTFHDFNPVGFAIFTMGEVCWTRQTSHQSHSRPKGLGAPFGGMDEADRSKDCRASASQSRAYAMHRMRMPFDRQMQICKSSRSGRAPGTRAAVLACLTSSRKSAALGQLRLSVRVPKMIPSVSIHFLKGW